MWRVLLLLSVFSINQVLAKERRKRHDCRTIQWSETVNVTSTEVTVRWHCCNSRVAPSYRLEMKSDDQTNCNCDYEKDLKTNECLHTFYNLCPHTNYEFSVTSIIDGHVYNYYGGHQQPVTINLQTHISSPGNLRMTEAKAISDTAVNLNWEHDCPNGEVMYIITWSPDDGAFLTKELELTVVHLRPATLYTFVASACNKLNSSMCASSTALAKTFPGEPSAPTTFEEVDVSSTAVHLQWNHPEDPNGPIDGYEIVCRPESKANFQTITTFINKTEECLVTGLEPWTIYSCSILAYNFQDFNKMTGNQSTLTTLTKPALPDQPPNLEIVDKTSDGLFLKWNRPYVPRGPIDGYVVRTSNGKIEIENKTASEQFRLSGLSTWTQYNISVHAFNIDGNDTLNGKVSTISVKTRPAAPSATRDVRVVKTISGETYLKWKRPLTPNGEIHGYYVKNLNDESEDIVSGFVLKFHLNDLSPDTNYTFSVYAYNVDGMERLDGTEASVNHTTKSEEPPLLEMVNLLRKDIFSEFSKTQALIRNMLRNFGEESDPGDQNHNSQKTIN